MILNDKTILLASKHKKEEAIAEPFFRHLNAHVQVADGFDTDQFGTFTGEIPRDSSPVAIALQKAKVAAKTFGYQHVLASEGTFLPHPALPMLPANHELLLIYDAITEEYTYEELISTHTNSSRLHSSEIDRLGRFLDKMKFGTHAIVFISESGAETIIKGITNEAYLHQLINQHLERQLTFRLETDMRACYNPTRMANIRDLADKFANRLATRCQQCMAYGFGKLKFTGSLPCMTCHGESSLYAHIVQYCPSCHFEIKRPRKDGKLKADQSYCFTCNP